MTYRRRWCDSTTAWRFTGFLAIGLVAGASHLVGQLPPQRPVLASSCTLRETSRTELVLDGHSTYIEPLAFTHGRAGLLLAGSPTYLWQHGTAVRNPVFGVVVATDGTVRRIPWPLVSHNVGDMRAVQLNDGSWGLVFAELEPTSQFPHEIFRSLWYGAFDGHAWHGLVQLPLPREGRIDPERLSPIAIQNDTLAVGVPIFEVNTTDGATLFMRKRGKWSANGVGTRQIAYVDPANLSGIGWQVLVIRTDSVDVNAPYLYQLNNAERNNAWFEVGKLLRHDRAELHSPLYLSSHGRWALSWLAREPQMRAAVVQAITGVSKRGPPTRLSAVSSDTDTPAPDAMLDIDTAATTYAATMSPNGTMLWATDHIVTISDLSKDNLRFVLARDGITAILGSIPNPFTGPFAVAMPSNSEIVLSGPLVRNRGTHAVSLVTLLIRLHVQCSASPQ